MSTDVEQLPVADEVIRRTQIVDLARSVPLGVLLPLETSVLLMIAIKHFDASPLTKGLIAASGGVGLLVLVDSKTGLEKLKLNVGQIFYFQNREVTAPVVRIDTDFLKNAVQTSTFSPLVY